MKLQAEISNDLLQRVKANISEMDDVALMYAGIQAFREATPELRQRAKDVPHGGETYSFEVDLVDDLCDIMMGELGAATDHTSLVHIALASLLLRTSDEDELDVRDGEGINSQVFGRFLVEKGVVNLKMLMKALRLAKSMGARIGDLAVEQGWLDDAKIELIGQEQAKNGRPFGLAAIDLGLLNQNQVYDLLEMQKKSKGGIGEALVQLDILTIEDMNQYFAEFSTSQGMTESAAPVGEEKVAESTSEPVVDAQSIDETPADDVSEPQVVEEEDMSQSPTGKRLLQFLTESFPELSKTIAGIVVKVEPTTHAGEAEQAEYTAQMNMSGDASCLLTLTVSNDFARVIMWGLFGMDFVDSTDMYPDAVGEFLNMLVGNASRSLEKEGIKTRGEAPNFDCEIPSDGKCFAFVVSGQIRGDDVHPVAPTAKGTLFLSKALV